MQTKKYVLFIVEGKNDQIEIQAMLRAYCAESLKEKYVDTLSFFFLGVCHAPSGYAIWQRSDGHIHSRSGSADSELRCPEGTGKHQKASV